MLIDVFERHKTGHRFQHTRKAPSKKGCPTHMSRCHFARLPTPLDRHLAGTSWPLDSYTHPGTTHRPPRHLFHPETPFQQVGRCCALVPKRKPQGRDHLSPRALNTWPSALLFPQLNLLQYAININRFLPSELKRACFIAKLLRYFSFAGRNFTFSRSPHGCPVAKTPSPGSSPQHQAIQLSPPTLRSSPLAQGDTLLTAAPL